MYKAVVSAGVKRPNRVSTNVQLLHDPPAVDPRAVGPPAVDQEQRQEAIRWMSVETRMLSPGHRRIQRKGCQEITCEHTTVWIFDMVRR